MADICNILIPHSFKLFDFGCIFEQSDSADASFRIRKNGNNGNPQNAITREIVMEHAGLFRIDYTFKSFPDRAIRNKVHGGMHINRAEHFHQSRIIMRQFTLLIDCGNAVVETGKDITELAFFIFKLPNG